MNEYGMNEYAYVWSRLSRRKYLDTDGGRRWYKNVSI